MTQETFERDIPLIHCKPHLLSTVLDGVHSLILQTSKLIWHQNSTIQIEKCHLQRIEKFKMHEECDCIRHASEVFIKNSAYLIGWNASSEGK